MSVRERDRAHLSTFALAKVDARMDEKYSNELDRGKAHLLLQKDFNIYKERSVSLL